MTAPVSIYDFAPPGIDLVPVPLSKYRGQVLLIVNVASQCGFTSQYAGLEALHRKFAPRGFSVLGFPCDQFGHQEPGDEATIRQFCSSQFDVTFPLFARVLVNGSNAHPLFQFLKQARPGLLGTESIKWNFTKFLVDRVGAVLKRYGPTDTPAVIESDLPAVLG